MPEQNEDYSYKIIELSGSSSVSIEKVVQNATGKPISSRVCRNEAGSGANRRSVKVCWIAFRQPSTTPQGARGCGSCGSASRALWRKILGTRVAPMSAATRLLP
jgi:hypothetical protein